MKHLITTYILISLAILMLTGCSVADLFNNDEDIPLLYCHNTESNEANLNVNKPILRQFMYAK